MISLIIFFKNSKNRHISRVSLRIIKHPVFELLTLSVVLMNCITILIDNSGKSSAIFSQIDTFFFVFYLTELFLKVSALGFLLSPDAYLSDGWNKLDFLVILTAILNKIIADYGYNLPAIRALRVLRPLKVISNIKQLQRILESLFSALPLLADSFLILCFCYLLYALAGLQLFSGLLKKTCVFAETGLFSAVTLCGNVACGPQEVCSKGLQNPKLGIMSFDDVFHSFLNVFQIVTMDNWTVIMYSMQKTFTNFVSVYFLSLVIIGGLFLVNLTLAIIKYKFSNIKTEPLRTPAVAAENLKEKRKETAYDFLQLREKGVWPARKKSAVSLSSIEKISTKSAKNSKKSNNLNIFSMRILSNLRSELGKFTNEISSYANELGKATLQIGKTVGVGKLIKAVNKISPINLLRKPKVADFLEEEEVFEKKIEDLDPKYLKLRVIESKPFVSSSETDVFEVVRPVAKKKVLVAVGTAAFNFRKKKTGFGKKTRRNSRSLRESLRVPRNVVGKEGEFLQKKMRIPLRNRGVSLCRSQRKSGGGVEIIEKTVFMLNNMLQSSRAAATAAKNKRFLNSSVHVAANASNSAFNGNSVKYHELRAKLREEVAAENCEKLKNLEDKYFNNAENFIEIMVIY